MTFARGRCQSYAKRAAAANNSSVAKLVEEHGDRKLTDLLLRLANCPKTQTTNLHGRCGSVYEGLAIYETLLTS
jgi:hypothetical protein